MKTWNGLPLIDDSTPMDELVNVLGPDGTYGRGYIPRDYNLYPEGYMAQPDQMILIPESEYDARIQEQEESKSSLEHLYLNGPAGQPVFENLDQNGHGYCWSYSTGQAVMLTRLVNNQPLIRLNPHSVAAIIKRGADEGGWCGLSAKFYKEVGCAPEGNGSGKWPLHSRNVSLDTPEMRTAMARFKIQEDWVDLTKQVYDQNLTQKQLHTCLLLNQPCATDYAWWGHSVCALRLVKVEAGSYGILIINSWKGWGRHGLGVLQGDRAVPMGAICVRSVVASD